MGYGSPITGCYRFSWDLCLLKIWSRTWRSLLAHQPMCHIFLASPISISKSCNSELVSEERVTRSYLHGWEDTSDESLVKQEENVSHEGNKILGAFWMKEELSELNFRHRVWCGRVLRSAEMIYSLRGWRNWCTFWKELTGWTRKWVHLAAKECWRLRPGQALGTLVQGENWWVWRSGLWEEAGYRYPGAGLGCDLWILLTSLHVVVALCQLLKEKI